MKNDAKLGMLAGVFGVIVAAVLFANAPPPASPRPGAAAPPAKEKPAQLPAPPAATAGAAPEGGTAALPATPVTRTRKDVDAQPASRVTGADEEP